MRFSDTIGNTALKQKLIQSVRENRISHALLFAGPEGCGNLPTAIAFARYIACSDRTAEDSCGKCPSCVKFNKLSHPDLHFSYPVVTRKNGERPKSIDLLPQWREALAEQPFMSYNDWIMRLDAENKQGNITVEECHDIIRRLSLKCYESPYKFLIMWMPECLGAAGNTLLKIVEEPPDNTLFIFVAQHPDKIINTITSRTQLIRFSRIEDKEIAESLMKSYSVSESAAVTFARLSEGNYATAINLAASSDAFNHGNAFLEWMRECYAVGKMMRKLLDRVDEFAKTGRESQKTFISYGLNLVRECMLLNLKQESLVRLREDEISGFSKFSDFITPHNADGIAEELSLAYFHLERNANPKILFLDLSFRLHYLLKQKQPVLS